MTISYSKNNLINVKSILHIIVRTTNHIFSYIYLFPVRIKLYTSIFVSINGP